jgi:hypothetical protein
MTLKRGSHRVGNFQPDGKIVVVCGLWLSTDLPR